VSRFSIPEDELGTLKPGRGEKGGAMKTKKQAIAIDYLRPVKRAPRSRRRNPANGLCENRRSLHCATLRSRWQFCLGALGTVSKLHCHLDRSVPGFPAHAAPDMTTCTAFVKESRMKIVNATNIQQKSG